VEERARPPGSGHCAGGARRGGCSNCIRRERSARGRAVQKLHASGASARRGDLQREPHTRCAGAPPPKKCHAPCSGELHATRCASAPRTLDATRPPPACRWGGRALTACIGRASRRPCANARGAAGARGDRGAARGEARRSAGGERSAVHACAGRAGVLRGAGPPREGARWSSWKSAAVFLFNSAEMSLFFACPSVYGRGTPAGAAGPRKDTAAAAPRHCSAHHRGGRALPRRERRVEGAVRGRAALEAASG
jgi:hypothetical protein